MIPRLLVCMLKAAYPIPFRVEMSSLLQSMKPSVMLFLRDSKPAMGLPVSSVAPFSASATYTRVKSV